jgi:hypothetical protein
MTKEQVARLVLVAHANGIRKGAEIATRAGGGFSQEDRDRHVAMAASNLEQQAQDALYESAQTIITRYTREEGT